MSYLTREDAPHKKARKRGHDDGDKNGGHAHAQGAVAAMDSYRPLGGIVESVPIDDYAVIAVLTRHDGLPFAATTCRSLPVRRPRRITATMTCTVYTRECARFRSKPMPTPAHRRHHPS